MHITVIGSGYVGLVAGACFEEIGHEVVLVDKDPTRYSSLAAGECPIHEEYLPELLARNRGRRLSFSNNLSKAVGPSRAVFVAVGTPPALNGEADLSYLESVAREIAGCIEDYKVIVGKSTVPMYTSEWVRRVMMMKGASPDLFEVVANPEFLREGTGVTDFLYPDRIVVGANTVEAANVLREIYKPVLDGSYYQRADALAAPAVAIPFRPSTDSIATSTRICAVI
jgi:UDPglucose 6-dehydrogenase